MVSSKPRKKSPAQPPGIDPETLRLVAQCLNHYATPGPTCTLLIDFIISGDRNVIKKEAEKIPKYKDLTVEIQRMWNVKTNVIPVIIGATGTISKSFRKYLSNVPGKHEVKELQKTAILGTAHTLRKILI
jgi:hypothetical protein